MECSHQQSVEKRNAASLFLCSWDQVTKWIKRNNFFEEVAVDTSALKICAILWVQKLVYISVVATIDTVSIYTLALKIYWMPFRTYINIPQLTITVIKGTLQSSS